MCDISIRLLNIKLKILHVFLFVKVKGRIFLKSFSLVKNQVRFKMNALPLKLVSNLCIYNLIKSWEKLLFERICDCFFFYLFHNNFINECCFEHILSRFFSEKYIYLLIFLFICMFQFNRRIFFICLKYHTPLIYYSFWQLFPMKT